MQQYVTPHPGRTNRPNVVDNDDYKMHILKRQYNPGEWEILIERWIPENGWSRTQILCNEQELNKIKEIILR